MFSKSIVVAALVAGAVANPVFERWDGCAAAVTGKNALGDASIRSADCASFLATTVTPAAITTTITVTGTSTTDKSGWKRAQVTYCPNKVPAYAVSACGGAEEGAATALYSSACSWLGYTDDSTTTVAPTTTTQTVYVLPTYASTCPSPSTVTVTQPLAGSGGAGYSYVSTATVTVTSQVGPYGTGYTPATTTTVIVTSPVGPVGTGYTPSVSTVTVTPQTVTVTESPIGATGSGYFPASTVTVTPSPSTLTVTESPVGATGSGYYPASTITVTASASNCTSSSPSSPTNGTTPANSTSTCLTLSDAQYITNSFIQLLEVTNYCATFDTSLAETLLADDFTDTSDSINFMANYSLTTVTFPSKGAFIGGQGAQPCIPVVETLNLWYDCSTITWRWRGFVAPQNIPVTGINVMEINSDKQIETNYSEFDNGAWLYNYGNPQCAGQTAKAVAAATANCTAPATKRSLDRSLLRH